VSSKNKNLSISKVDLARKLATINYNSSLLRLDQVLEMIDDMGFDPSEPLTCIYICKDLKRNASQIESYLQDKQWAISYETTPERNLLSLQMNRAFSLKSSQVATDLSEAGLDIVEADRIEVSCSEPVVEYLSQTYGVVDVRQTGDKVLVFTEPSAISSAQVEALLEAGGYMGSATTSKSNCVHKKLFADF
jgi:hypothetical protein